MPAARPDEPILEKLRLLGQRRALEEDVARFIFEFVNAPRVGEVYNLGGGKDNSCSILEAFDLTSAITGKKQVWTYVDENRIGDHICYYSDLRKTRSHYPGWNITKSLRHTIEEIVESWHRRLSV